jgi:hypothetical protein
MESKTIEPQVMCAIRAASLPLSPDYATLPNVAKTATGRFRDTILFFLQVLDQRSPVHAALPAGGQEEAVSSIVDVAKCPFDPDAETVLVACALDDGVLLSLGADDRWRTASVDVIMLAPAADHERQVAISNAHDAATADVVVAARAEARSQHKFENWDHLTGGALRAAQLDDWFDECRTRPGLEQVVMRSMALACGNGWHADGDLVKKLASDSSEPVFEIRAWFNGSNNVRILFGRKASGMIAVGFGGTKTHPDWYDHALPHARGFLSDD